MSPSCFATVVRFDEGLPTGNFGSEAALYGESHEKEMQKYMPMLRIDGFIGECGMNITLPRAVVESTDKT